MPRKPLQLSRRLGTTRPIGRAQIFCQCDKCGGLVDPRYGTDADSWCPHCDAIGSVICQDGQIPMPPLYGKWVRKEVERRGSAHVAQSSAPNASTMPVPFPARTGESTMKTAKTHTGTYSCLNCLTEFDLVAETRLKCDDCGGALLQGTVEELSDEEAGQEDDRT